MSYYKLFSPIRDQQSGFFQLAEVCCVFSPNDRVYFFDYKDEALNALGKVDHFEILNKSADPIRFKRGERELLIQQVFK